MREHTNPAKMMEITHCSDESVNLVHEPVVPGRAAAGDGAENVTDEIIRDVELAASDACSSERTQEKG